MEILKMDIFSLREQEIFNTIKELKHCDFVIIGGYAVNAYTLPRFSVDCDIVIRNRKKLYEIEKILHKMNYKKLKLPPRGQYSGEFARYEKKLDNNFRVNIDALIEHIVDRMTGVKFSAEWIFQHSGEKKLIGKTISEELHPQIINIDALVVMKIISCRTTDIRDVFMMLPYVKNKDRVRKEVSLLYNFKDRITKIVEKVTSKQFKDDLSGMYGHFDSKVFEKHKKILLSLHDES